MNKPLFLFVGPSGCGKTATAKVLVKKHKRKQLESYTDREPRFDGETGHIFLSEEEFKKLGELAAYTFYNGKHYGATFEQLNESDIYVIDVPGVESLLKKLKDDNRLICIFYFDVSVYNRILRMRDRGDDDSAIVTRLLVDEKFDWFKRLDSLVWHYNNIIGKDVQFYPINANNNLECVVDLVLYYMKRNMGEDI
jgi:guanylate kinase